MNKQLVEKDQRFIITLLDLNDFNGFSMMQTNKMWGLIHDR
jgi:hypothetical protein